MKLLREFIREVLCEMEEHTFYRVQPVGNNLFGHQSGLAYEKVNGVFAFVDPKQLFDTYTWVHVKKRIDQYEMVKFSGTIVDQPEDSEGVVVQPRKVLSRMPLSDWLETLN